MKTKKIILASGSPRRKELLSWAGVDFEIVVSEIDETPHPKESPSKMVGRLSSGKAESVAQLLLSRDPRFEGIVLAADTTVVSPKGKILGKPENEKDALRMISEIEGKTHSVLTGYTLIKIQKGKVSKRCSRVVKTLVKMRPLSAQERKQYWLRGESMDKAGAYAAQGFGMVLIEKIIGSYTNVVGLPMSEVLSDLKKF